jgi:hypothetical protein
MAELIVRQNELSNTSNGQKKVTLTKDQVKQGIKSIQSKAESGQELRAKYAVEDDKISLSRPGDSQKVA